MKILRDCMNNGNVNDDNASVTNCNKRAFSELEKIYTNAYKCCYVHMKCTPLKMKMMILKKIQNLNIVYLLPKLNMIT